MQSFKNCAYTVSEKTHQQKVFAEYLTTKDEINVPITLSVFRDKIFNYLYIKVMCMMWMHTSDR